MGAGRAVGEDLVEAGVAVTGLAAGPGLGEVVGAAHVALCALVGAGPHTGRVSHIGVLAAGRPAHTALGEGIAVLAPDRELHPVHGLAFSLGSNASAARVHAVDVVVLQVPATDEALARTVLLLDLVLVAVHGHPGHAGAVVVQVPAPRLAVPGPTAGVVHLILNVGMTGHGPRPGHAVDGSADGDDAVGIHGDHGLVRIGVLVDSEGLGLVGPILGVGGHEHQVVYLHAIRIGPPDLPVVVVGHGYAKDRVGLACGIGLRGQKRGIAIQYCGIFRILVLVVFAHDDRRGVHESEEHVCVARAFLGEGIEPNHLLAAQIVCEHLLYFVLPVGQVHEEMHRGADAGPLAVGQEVSALVVQVRSEVVQS